MKPYLVNEIRNYGITIKKNEPIVLNEQVCSESTVKQLQECLAATCIEGTGKNAFATALYKAAGKTGTAKVNDGKFKYGDGVYQSAFAGYFPAENPKYSIIVVIKNKPRIANYYGGTVAAPVFREIADHLYKYFIEHQTPVQIPAVADSMLYTFSGLKKEVMTISSQFGYSYTDQLVGNWRKSFLKNNTLQSQTINTAGNIMPDVKGMGLKDALYVLETAGMKIQVSGKGRIFNQSVAAGSSVAKGQEIILYLN